MYSHLRWHADKLSIAQLFTLIHFDLFFLELKCSNVMSIAVSYIHDFLINTSEDDLEEWVTNLGISTLQKPNIQAGLSTMGT